MKKRVRFAPSPTGPFHIGSARVALFNYLFAKKNKGDFILRIEDTDKTRSKREYELDIIRSIKWLNINYDEGVTEESEKGSYGPYRQSERGEIYKKYLQKLLQEDKAYPCFCSAEELEKERKKQLERGEAPRYSGKCAQKKNEKKGDFVIRFRSPKEESTTFNDLIRGKVSFDNNEIGDFVIGKSDFSALYNFVVVIDDHEMEISHVIRGEDHISNTPRQILIQKALGINTPYYAHLPLILGPDKSKLSKRHAAVSVQEYKEMGYLPEAMINFISFLGWNPGGEREIYSLEEIIEEFKLEKCKKSGAVFNIDKLDSINGYYIRQKDDNELAEMCVPFLTESGFLEQKEGKYFNSQGKQFSLEDIAKTVSICKERMKNLSEITKLADYFFAPVDYDKEMLRWKNMSDEEIYDSLKRGEEAVLEIDKWDMESIEKTLIERAGSDKGSFLWPFRVALSGKKASAGPFEISWVLGRDEVLKRLRKAKKKL